MTDELVLQVWDALTPSRLTFTSPPPQHMSTLIEDLNLQRGLLKMIRERTPNVELIGGTRVEGITREQGVGGVGEWPVVRMTGGKGLRARLIVRKVPSSSLSSLPVSLDYADPCTLRARCNLGRR